MKRSSVNSNDVDFQSLQFMDIFLITVTAIIGIIGLSATIEGYFKTNINPFLRIILGAGALCLIIPETYTDFIGIILVALVFGLNWAKSKKDEQALNLNL